MENKLNFLGKLDFSDIDLTAPDKVVEKILMQLPEATYNIIMGKIQSYDGHVFSYSKHTLYGITEALSSFEKTVDIQSELGKIGQETHKFECFLYTPEYDKYKYRVFFMQYGIANYPVTVVLDDTVVESISDASAEYIRTCNTREQLESLIYEILNSKRLVSVMQELIRINQAKKQTKNSIQTENCDEVK